MGDDKKKPGGKKSGTLLKLVALVILGLIGAEIGSKMTGRSEWSPVYQVKMLLKAQR
jgi:hypothetical protein